MDTPNTRASNGPRNIKNALYCWVDGSNVWAWIVNVSLQHPTFDHDPDISQEFLFLFNLNFQINLN